MWKLVGVMCGLSIQFDYIVMNDMWLMRRSRTITTVQQVIINRCMGTPIDDEEGVEPL